MVEVLIQQFLTILSILIVNEITYMMDNLITCRQIRLRYTLFGMLYRTEQIS